MLTAARFGTKMPSSRRSVTTPEVRDDLGADTYSSTLKYVMFLGKYKKNHMFLWTQRFDRMCFFFFFAFIRQPLQTTLILPF